MTVRVPSLSSVLLGGVGSDSDEATAVLEAIRAESERATDAAERARLELVLATLQERRREPREATRHHAAAWELMPSSAGALQALIGVTLRRNAIENLGPLLERLADVANAAGEKQQAHLLLAELRRRQGDAEGSQATLERWLDEHPDDPGAWLALDVLASQTSQAALSERARLGRAGAAHDPRWRASLLLDCARMRAEAGDEAALDLCRQAADELESLPVLTFWERCARGLKRWGEASEVAERAAALLLRALDDEELARRSEVASWQRNPTHAALLGVRAAEWARRADETERSLTLLERCAQACPSELLPQLAWLFARRENSHLPGLEGFLAERAEQVGSRRLAAGLWLDLAELARRSADIARVRRAAEQALAAAPTSLRTWAFLLDVMELGGAMQDYVAALEGFAPRLEAARADGLLGAAVIAALADAGTTTEPQAQIQRLVNAAREAGADTVLVARLEAALAHRVGDRSSYRSALSDLARQGSAVDRVDAGLTLLRSHLLQADASAASSAQGALDAVAALPLADHPLPAVLRALVLPLWTGERSADDSSAWEKALARSAPDSPLREGAKLVTIRRLLEADQRHAAVLRLRGTLEETPGDPVSAAALADLLTHDDPEAAASVLAHAARLQSDSDLRGGWLLRAARLLWTLGKSAEALALIREAEALVPRAARPWLVWGSRLEDTDHLGERARLLDQQQEDRGSFVALERLSLSGRLSSGEAPHVESIPHAADDESLADESGHAALRWLQALSNAARRPHVGSSPESQTLDELPEAPPGLSQTFAYGRLLEQGDASPEEYLARARAWARAAEDATGVDAALAWLAASRRARSLPDEVGARELLGTRLDAPELRGASALLAWLLDPSCGPDRARELARLIRTVPSETAAGQSLQWARLELTGPGDDWGERADTLEALAASKAHLDPQLGGDPSSIGTLLILAGFDALAAADAERAAALFQRATEVLPDDFAGWDGLRATASRLDDAPTEARACVELARRSASSQRAAALWERAGVLYQDVLENEPRAEEAFAAALAQDFSREQAFRRLFLLVKGRSDRERLVELVEGRLSAVDDPRQVSELLWEKARLTRALGDERGALRALDQLLERAPDHLGALALTSELCLRDDQYARAADCLSRIAEHSQVSREQRILSGLAAADLYERKLYDGPRAGRLLRALEESGLDADPALSERLAFAALRDERWGEAIERFERLLELTSSSESRATAAAFLLALYRDRLPSRDRALVAARILLDERPADTDGLLFLLEELEPAESQPWALRALEHLRAELTTGPIDAERLHLVVLSAHALGWTRTELAAYGALELLDRLGTAEASNLAAWRARSTRLPNDQTPAANAEDLDAIASPSDDGPYLAVARLLTMSCPQVIEPHLEELGLGPDRLLAARAEADTRWSQLDREVRGWMGWLGLELDVYVGGDNPTAILALAGARSLVIGSDWSGPLDGHRRARLVACLYGLARGTAPVVLRGESSAARLIAAAARAVEVHQVERALAPSDATPEPTQDSRDLIQDLSERIANALDEQTRGRIAGALTALPESREAFSNWYAGSRLSIVRAGMIAAGDPGAARELITAAGDEGDLGERAVRDAIAFALSDDFAGLRTRLGLEET